MTIRLRIDNIDNLPDGGPLQYASTQRGFVIGRSESLDWTLPDPSRMISSKHCEIVYEGGGYWLSDVSTNGTFLNGARQRMKSPHRLSDGDRIAIGHYVIVAEIEEGASASAAYRETSSPPAQAFDDIWGNPGPAPAPIDRRALMPARQQPQRAADFSQEFLGFPAARPAEPEQPPSRPAFEAPARPGGFGNVGDPFSLPPQPQAPLPASIAAQSRHELTTAPPSVAPPAVSPFRPEAPYSAAPPAMTDDVLRRFAQGAGLDPQIFSGRNAGDNAEELGRAMRLVVENVQLLLKARQAAKVLARSSKRTMLGRINNPLKFLPTPEEVLEVLFTGRRAGYMAAVEAFEEAFGDLKRHELATYAAMQSALARLLADLSPESIEGKVAGSAFKSRAASNWEMYVARWEAKTEPYENGMLDVFLTYFAEAYDEGQNSK